ncbi:pyridoxamine 5'-phosphate oxidase family protein [uncultured Methanobrevibacter sp.]|uniref:pyridoxamine 5'-phosphate oxidase family protein n=1 Tax=uncultured Methanobrevibacter sp. TaxID=253161 RepID=UPI002610285C|nr:pyridoxamine 5'-phosphate oxidase family protein [uncultured Methanobrevibacter sp.]
MNDVIKFLSENPLVYLATKGLDGNAKVRPILYYFEENNKPYFCTSNKKPMYKELDNNPNFEITTATADFAWIRISGKVEFTSNIELKQKVIDSNELVKSLYQSGDNPEFEVFTISGDVTIADFSGNPPRNYKI